MPKSRSRRRPPPARRPRPATPRAPLVPQPAPGARGTVERLSAPVLLWFTSKPKVLLPALTVLLLLAGLLAPPAVGVPVLLVLALLISWLSYLSWPVVGAAPRLLRVATVGLVLAAAAGRAQA